MSLSNDPPARTKRDPYLPYRRVLLPAERVRALSKRRPWRAVRDAAISWAFIVGAWVAAAAIGEWWAIALAAPIVGNRFYALWIIGHDGLHRRLIEGTARNDLFCDLVVLAPIGTITRINNRNHLKHHQYLATEDDPDRHKHGSYNKRTRLELAGYLTAVGSVVYTVGHVFHRYKDMEARQSEAARAAASGPEARPRYRARDILMLAGWQVVLFATLTLLFGWWAYLLLWWVPVFVFTFLADNLRTFVEHSQPTNDAEADGHRLVTNHPSWFERQLLSPMKMNHHAAHHLWPSIPYYNLPQADAEMRQARGSRHHDPWFVPRLRVALRPPASPRRSAAGAGERVTPAAPGTIAPSAPPEIAAAAPPLIETEAVGRCDVCGGTDAAEVAAGYDYELITCRNRWTYVRCASCAHVWLDPRPSADALGVIYPPTYYAYNYEELSPLLRRGKELLDERKLRTILRGVDGLPHRYLDVGCGDGRYLEVLARKGVPRAQLAGLELDERMVAQLNHRGFEAYCERVETCDRFAPESLDLVTMFHVIEHIDSPSAVVERLAGWLRPGGVLALETPNIDSLDARWFHRGTWGGYHIPRHWHLFSPTNFERLVADVGLVPEGIHYQTGHAFWMYSFHHVLRYAKRPKRRLARLFDPLRSVVPLLGFTAFDKARAALGSRTSAMLLIARKP